MSGPVISVQNLHVSFFTKIGEIKAVSGISYQVKKGRVLGVVGESGCGKSVSAYTIMGLLEYPGRITHGTINFQGQELTQITQKNYQNLRGKKMAMIFQEPMTALNPVLTVGYQISEQILRHMPVNASEAKESSVDLLKKVGIPSPHKRYHQYPHELSGGMKQRAMIAMALSCGPDFLIADEPTTALDVTIQAQILELIQELQEQLQMTVQFITHDLGVISEISDDVLVMYAGKVVESGVSQEIFKKPMHPYTHGLLASIPKFGNPQKTLHTIPGNVPSPLELPVGCAFQNRCPYAINKCRESIPELEEISGTDRKVACFAPLIN